MSDRPTGTRAFVGVGSNIEPRRNIPAALRRLKVVVTVVGCSTFYRTEPIGAPHQPAFLNGLWEVRTDLPPRALKARLHAIEADLGRRRTADPNAPRPIDLDLVVYGDLTCEEPDLVLPHPDLERDFVHAPLLELAPEILDGPLGDAIGGWIGRTPARRPTGEPDRSLTGALRAMLEGEQQGM
ncbi:MAG: 2-amino-4-hydroxy-6-hydroxymethyldihydropteridine diphosphokinase [Phycisphaerae bacterium]